MARQYSPKSFLRQAPNALLRSYLTSRAVGDDLPWDHLEEKNINPVYRAIDSAPDKLKAEIVRDFRDILDMADESGMKTLIDEGSSRHHGVDLAPLVRNSETLLEASFGVFLNYLEVFRVASQFHHADNLPSQSWQKRKGLPLASTPVEWEDTERLEAAISGYYREKEGRGQRCHIDHYERGGRLYWFAYPEDYPEGKLIYDDEGELRLQTQRPAFEVIFVYSSQKRSLETFARGGRKTGNELQVLFGKAVLGVELSESQDGGVVYELNALFHRDFPFPTDPQDGIEEVRVRRLRLNVMGQHSRRITLEASARDHPRAIYDLLDDVVAGDRIPKDLLRVQGAGFRLLFRPDVHSRRRVLTFSVSSPDSCSLKHDLDPRHEAARGCLKRWGIDVSDLSDDDPPRRGGNAQYVIRH